MWRADKSVSQMLGEAKDIQETVELLEKNIPTDKKLWSRAKALARKKFDVYPSAYANSWASKWYKKKGGKWKVLKESTEPYIENLAVDNSEEDTKNLNDMAFEPEKQEDDLPVLKVIKGRNRFNPQTMRGSSLRLEYFRGILNKSKELNEEI
jgi:hypothetical protein